jgi:HD-GYP domain-containing protein (c-di-GMP phosphodiesterase class II)
MTAYKIKEIPPNSFFPQPVYLDEGFVLTAPELPFSAGLGHVLDDWEFEEVYCEGEPGPEYTGESFGAAEGGDAPPGTPLSDEERVRRAENFYEEFYTYVKRLFMFAAIGTALDLGEITQWVRNLCALIREDRRYLLRVQRALPPGQDNDFLADHTVKSTIISVVIGYYLKLPYHRLIELGIAALVHEIGMIRIPQRIYTARRSLSPEERVKILTHPVASYNILKGNHFPLSISMAALQHHERENGSGYPQHLTGDKISLYAKIIAVACSYEALTAARPHKDAKDGHTGIVDLLKNEGKAYDDSVIRALVYSLSVYPIGLYVLLSSGQKGQVVDVNPEFPRYPIVRILGEPGPDGRDPVVQTSAEGVRIERPLGPEELYTAPPGS